MEAGSPPPWPPEPRLSQSGLAVTQPCGSRKLEAASSTTTPPRHEGPTLPLLAETPLELQGEERGREEHLAGRVERDVVGGVGGRYGVVFATTTVDAFRY